MFQATLKRIRTGKPDVISFHVPASLSEKLKKELIKSPEYSLVTIGKPKKPRTTGELSQNHRIAFLINLISDETGYTYTEAKTQAKYDSLPRGYPYREISVFNPKIGKIQEQIEPYHEDELDTVQASILIETLQRWCDVLEIVYT